MRSMRIRIRILVGLYRLQKLDFDLENILCVGVPTSYVLILVNFLAPGSGSVFPIRIWMQMQENQINADPDPKHWLSHESRR